ncbi:MAG TPA: glycosyltransferase [Bryobacteraceae bacterium]|jgi:GT2 family glycosyltransferase|nr:glycosyltransferase [Bryobacteraceae bacterium]
MPETRRRDTQKREQPVKTAEIPQEPQEEIIEPRISAILIGYNQAAALRRAIAALEASTDRERLEILVIDCGSHDESPQLDTEFEKITLLRLPMHLGATKAMNIGVRTAKAEILFFLSPKVEVAPGTVPQLAAKLEEEGETVAVCPLLVDPAGRIVSKDHDISAAIAGKDEGSAVDASAESVEMAYPGLDALMIRKSFLKGMNYFDERFGNSWADADLAMQIRRAQRKIRLFPAIRATYYDEPDPAASDPLYAADRALGAAAFVGKYRGFVSGLLFRAAAIFRALGRFDLKQTGALISGQKLDGTQAM